MSELKFTKSTDTEHKIQLESTLIFANWCQGIAFGGQVARLEVGTSFVGNGTNIKITGKSENGKSLGKIKDRIHFNKYVGELNIPEDIEPGDEIYFEVDISDNGLSGESNRIPAFPPVKVSNLQWSAKEGRRGDVLTLSADMEGLRDDTEVIVTIYEHDQDGAHDRITELLALVKNKRIEVQWEYEYHEDTGEIPTEEEMRQFGGKYNPPEYFFTLKVGSAEYGRSQESGLLTFRDWIELNLIDADDQPVPDVEYVVTLPDGSEKKGTLDKDGFARVDGIPPGQCEISYILEDD